MLTCGIDIGSSRTKCVIMDGNRVLQGRGIAHTGANLARASRNTLKEALREAGCEEYDLTVIVGTGFGRFAIPFSHKRATEIFCHAKGALYRYPNTRTILDMGGQNLTAIRIDADGDVIDFAMNDKCSAGTGRFLESLTDLLGMTWDELRVAPLEATEQLMISNVCSVYAEQEIINFLETGKLVEDILGGVFMSLAGRGASLLRRVGLENEITVTGGGSHVKGVVEGLKKTISMKVNSGIGGIFIGAMGAALIGLDGTNRKP